MRILYIITQGEHGGGQKNVLDLAKGMTENGQEVSVATGEIENEGDKWLSNELHKKIKGEIIETKTLQREVKPFRDIKAVLEIIQCLRKIKPNIVHLHSSKAGVVGGLACFIYNFIEFFNYKNKTKNKYIKSVYTVHGFVFLEPMNNLKKIIYIFLEFISSLCRNFTILISEQDIKAGKNYLILRDKKNYKLIYNGLSDKIMAEMLEKHEAREYLIKLIPPIPYGKTSATIVGTIANLYKTKGLEYLIDAAKKVIDLRKNILFVVLGFGEDKYLEELKDRVKKNKLENNFFFLGKTPNAFKYLKGFDLFVLTSVKEGLPYTLLEAKMAGVPIVASKVGGIPELAKNIEISLTESKNAEDISLKILENLNFPKKEEDRKMGLPQIYSLKNMINSTVEVYKNIK